jgi:hypothetical protein
MLPGGFFVMEDRVRQGDGHGTPFLPHFLPQIGAVRQVHNSQTVSGCFHLLERTGYYDSMRCIRGAR